MALGTLTLADLQRTVNASTIYEVGIDQTFAAIDATLAVHNAQMTEIFSALAERTTEQAERYGGTDGMTMEDADELTVPHPQKITAGSNVGYPLNSAMGALQWSEMWAKKATVQELTAQVNAMMDADRNRVIRDLKRSFMLATNYTHTDHLVNNIDIPVKRLVNADSAVIPPGPNGETFTASSHTHYIARVSTFASTDLDALINTVKEHYASGNIVVLINTAQAASVSGFTGFTAYVDPRVMQPTSATYATNKPAEQVNLYNRTIGLYAGAEIVIKPWIPANYLFCYNTSAAKPIRYRYDPDYGDGLQLVFNVPGFPLTCRGYRRIFGIGVRERINGSLLYVGGTSWADPSIT